MRLINAMSLRDGGTTTITVSKGLFQSVSYTVDFSVPWDGRDRYVFRGAEQDRLEMGGAEEAQIQHWLSERVNRKYGRAAVTNFLDGAGENPGRGKWLYALNFLKILITERKSVPSKQVAAPNQANDET